MTWTLKRERINRHASIGGGSVMLWCVRNEVGHIMAAYVEKDHAIYHGRLRAKECKIDPDSIEETE